MKRSVCDNFVFQSAALRRRGAVVSLVAALSLLLLVPSFAAAQYRQDRVTDYGAAPVPNPGIAEKSGAKLPLELEFTTSDNKPVTLGAMFNHGRPVLVSLVYFSCPSICNFNQESLASAVRQGPLGLKLGQDYDILVVSIDPDDKPKDAATKRKNYLGRIPLPESQQGFTYLTGSEANIKMLADTVGFGFKRQIEGDKFLHSSGVFVCTADGRLSQTILGIDFQQDQLHNSLRQAAGGSIGSGMLSFAIACGAMKYNEKTGQYAANPYFYVGVVGGLISIIFVGTLLTILWRDEFKKNKHPFAAPPSPPATA